MEIDPKTIQGDWKVVDVNTNKEAFVYTEGVMAGLCILGDSKTPCFEGAAFFSLEDEDFKKFTAAITKYANIGGNLAMENENEKVQDEELEQKEASNFEDETEPESEPEGSDQNQENESESMMSHFQVATMKMTRII